MIEALAALTARRLNRFTGNGAIATDFVRYRLAELLNGGIICTVSILIGFWTGTVIKTMLALMSFYAIRTMTGGFHLPLDWCAAVSTGFILLIVHSDVGHYLVLNGLAFALMALFARRGRWRWVALAWAGSNFYIGSDWLARCFLLQALTLIDLKGGELHVEEAGRLVGKTFGIKRH